MKKYIFLFLLLNGVFVFSQTKEIDSLKKSLSETKTQTVKLDLYDALIKAYQYRSLDSALIYNDSLRQIAKTLNNEDKLMSSLYNASVIASSKADYEKSITYQKEYLEYIKKKNDTVKLSMSYYQLGASHMFLEHRTEAISYFNKALDLAEQAEDLSLASKILNAFGAMYKNYNQYGKALSYYNRAIKINKKLKDTFAIGVLYNGVGIVHLRQKNKDSALHYFKTSLKYAEIVKNVQLKSYQYRNLGVLLGGDKKYDEAEAYHNKALKLRRDVGDSLNIAGSYIDLGELNIKKGDYKNAENYLFDGLKILKKTKAKSNERLVYDGLSRIYEATNQYKKANQYIKLYLKLNDSLNNNDYRGKVNEIQLKYDTEKKDKELAEQQLIVDKQELDLQKKQAQYKLMTGFVIFLLLISILTWFLFQQRQKRKDQEIVSLKREQQVKTLELLMEGEEKERLRIAKELHDGVNVDLSSIKYRLTSLLEQNNNVINEVVAMIDKSCEQVRAISHDLVPPSLKDFSLVDAVQDFCSTKNNLHQPEITFSSLGEAITISKKAEVNIFRIVQELVNNSIKHANAKEIDVQLSCQDNHMQLTVEDNGKGFNKNEVVTGIGLQNIKSRIDYLGAKLDLRSDNKGTSYVIDINTEHLV